MADKKLRCIWQAMYCTIPTSEELPSKELVKSITFTIFNKAGLKFSVAEFNGYFQGNTIVFSDYVAYMRSEISKSSKSDQKCYEAFEDTTWCICKELSFDKFLYYLEVNEAEARKIWEVFNELCKIGTLPPKMNEIEVNWIGEKLSSRLGQHWQPVSSECNLTYCELMDLLCNQCFSKATPRKVTKAINYFHSWLIQEVSMSGWLYVPSLKLLGSMSLWKKYWFTLTPGQLTYFADDRVESKKIGSFSLDKLSKIEELPGSSSGIFTLKCPFVFKIKTNGNEEIQLAATDRYQRKAWMDALSQVIEGMPADAGPEEIHLNKKKSRSISNKGETVEEKVLSKPAISSKFATQYIPSISANTPVMQKIPLSKQDEKIKEQVDKLLDVFARIDKNKDGAICLTEFHDFLKLIDVNLPQGTVSNLFLHIDVNQDDSITFDEFYHCFTNEILDEKGSTIRTTETDNELQSAFFHAAPSENIDFKEFTEHLWEKRHQSRKSMFIKSLRGISNEENDQSLQKLQMFMTDFELLDNNEEDLEWKKEEKADRLALYMKERWKAFSSFRRTGISGDSVMTGREEIVADVLPGKHNLVDLACFSDLPPIEPNYVVVDNVIWLKGTANCSGKAIFPSNFDAVLPIDIATTEHLRYYGASLADNAQVEVSLVYRHGIQDFSYQNNYLQDYVERETGGAGIERHDFCHLDCPLEADSGYFVIGKMVDDKLYLTGFKVPTRHTVYVPGGVIHSNDYLKGTWRTMLSDATDIDHVHLVKHSREKDCNKLTKFTFTFGH